MQKCHSGFTLIFTMLFVSPCESSDFLRPRVLATPPETQEFEGPLPFLSKILLDLLCLQEGKEAKQCLGRTEKVRGLLSCP